MKIRDLNGKKVCLLGFGREGQATLLMIEKDAPQADVTIADMNPNLQTTHYKLQTGADYLKNLGQFDIIIKSPGIPPKPEIEKHRSTLTNSTQLFLDSIADTGAMVIGVTGSKGKSTTSSLIYEILKAAGKDVHLVGNIGKPAIEYVDQAKKQAIFVMELSSYQLMDLSVSPHIAVITSFFPEHLDYHGSLEAYKDAKKHITRFQKATDMVFYNEKMPGAVEIASESKGRRIPFSAEDAPVRIEETKLLGRHNLSNIGAACKVAAELKIDAKICLDVVRHFQGLPHRLQFLGTHHGIDWVDDAISTTPESTIAALDALGERVHTIILGGQDRGYDFDELARRLAKSNVRTAILFPGSGPRIREAIEKTGSQMILHEATNMKTAVFLAIESTKPRSICLLSTASPSYGMFKNFEDKGDQFQKYIKN